MERFIVAPDWYRRAIERGQPDRNRADRLPGPPGDRNANRDGGAHADAVGVVRDGNGAGERDGDADAGSEAIDG